MLKNLIKTVRSEFSGLAAKDHVARIAAYHRIQASPGFRAAAYYVQEALTEAGIAAEVISLPAQEGLSYWGQSGFQEWHALASTLEIVEPEDAQAKLCDFRESKISLIQRSAPTSPIEAEVVLLQDGTKVEEYEKLDLQGKIVLTKGDVDRVRELAVERYGALGIVYDGMREWPPVRQQMDLPDARQYTSFWWCGGEKRCFGFVLSPRQGASLRQLIQKRAQEGKSPVKVRAFVDSRLYDGAMEVVSAYIPGETAEEILVVAHLCHPEPSANDNASGCGAALEAARTLQTLINAGRLSRPKRAIHFLWVPEISGTYGYLATYENEIPRLLAGINLDMVGEDQGPCGSVWIVEYPSEAMPSFVGDLMARIQEELADNVKNLAGNESFGLFRHGVSRFSGGSDHYILSDPSVGVPTPMLIQWPDKFYHTSEDTVDKVSPSMLANVGVATVVYAYFLANAGATEAQWLAHEMLTRYKGVTARRIQSSITEAISTDKVEELAKNLHLLMKKAAYWAGREREALASLQRLASDIGTVVDKAQTIAAQTLQEEVGRAKELFFERAKALGAGELAPMPPRELDSWEERAAQMIPVKKCRGPISPRAFMRQLPFERREEIYKWQEEHKTGGELAVLALYWTDGKRNLLEIADLVEMESGLRDTEFLVKYFELLHELGLIALAA